MTTDRDSQRSAVYAWGRALCADEKPLTLPECVALVAQVWADYRPGRRPPEVGDGRGTRWGWAYGSHRITLNRGVRQPTIVLHEIAHTLLPDEKHGPKFATLMLNLLARYGGKSKVEARRLGAGLKPRRVHFAQEKDVPQPKSRAYRTWRKQREALEAKVREAQRALYEWDSKRPAA